MAAHSHYHSLVLDLLFLPSKHQTNSKKITLPSFLPSFFLWPHKSGGVIAKFGVFFGWKVFLLLLPNYKLSINVTI